MTKTIFLGILAIVWLACSILEHILEKFIEE